MIKASTLFTLLLIDVLSLFPSIAYTQNSTIDSLRSMLRVDKEDTVKVLHLNKLAREILYSNTDSAALLSTQALHIAEKQDWKKGIAASYFLLGATRYLKGDYSSALEHENKALSFYQQLKDKSGEAKAFRLFGLIYAEQGEYPLALEYHLRSLELNKELGDKRSTGVDYGNIGTVYTYQGDFSKALDYLFSALKTAEELGDKETISNFLNNIGRVYNDQANYTKALDFFFKALKINEQTGDKYRTAFNLGNIGLVYSGLHDYDKALEYYSKALKIAEDIGDKSSTSRHLGNIGGLYYIQGNYNKALSYYIRASKISQELGDKFIFSSWEGSIGRTYIKMGKFKEAEIMLKKSIALADSIGADESMRQFEEALSQLYDTTGRYALALVHYKKAMILEDSIFNKEKNVEITRKEMQYEFDKKEAIAKAEQDKREAEAKRIKNQQYFVIAFLGIIVLASIIIALIQFRNNKQKQKANLLLQEKNQKIEHTLAELKSTQTQLIQSEKMASLGELTVGIAHEIQNPLNFVNNFSEVNRELLIEMKNEIDKGNLEEVKSLADGVMDNQEKINHHGKRADAIVKGMLQHSRVSSGAKEPTDINALCDEYLRLAYHGLRAKDKSFNAITKTEFDGTIGKIHLMPQEVGRAILNLINNALYAVDEKRKTTSDGYEPTVIVSTRKERGKIEAKVKDNGNGIPQKVRHKIFQPFFTTKPTGQGTGLGLSLAYDIIKAHGGEIKVETREGEGSEFIVELPISE